MSGYSWLGGALGLKTRLIGLVGSGLDEKDCSHRTMNAQACHILSLVFQSVVRIFLCALSSYAVAARRSISCCGWSLTTSHQFDTLWLMSLMTSVWVGGRNKRMPAIPANGSAYILAGSVWRAIQRHRAVLVFLPP